MFPPLTARPTYRPLPSFPALRFPLLPTLPQLDFRTPVFPVWQYISSYSPSSYPSPSCLTTRIVFCWQHFLPALLLFINMLRSLLLSLFFRGCYFSFSLNPPSGRAASPVRGNWFRHLPPVPPPWSKQLRRDALFGPAVRPATHLPPPSGLGSASCPSAVAFPSYLLFSAVLVRALQTPSLGDYFLGLAPLHLRALFFMLSRKELFARRNLPHSARLARFFVPHCVREAASVPVPPLLLSRRFAVNRRPLRASRARGVSPRVPRSWHLCRPPVWPAPISTVLLFCSTTHVPLLYPAGALPASRVLLRVFPSRGFPPTRLPGRGLAPALFRCCLRPASLRGPARLSGPSSTLIKCGL